ncbi:hypothetical protein HMPREF0201_02817 [Cedecea davisae DSM 4568]|uniref:Uncharacterized protein n=1 Tax=Cedecea davisae DSM 4568 TaxID=566551 RepID=S3ITY7_9ENTR|nr:hypothetical protein HMPREF0201_02817 [Cedecea davisae DSM 4568]
MTITPSLFNPAYLNRWRNIGNLCPVKLCLSAIYRPVCLFYRQTIQKAHCRL